MVVYRRNMLIAGLSDDEPDPYTYTDVTGQSPSTAVTSNSITVSDINIDADITITGGTYSINGGGFTSAPGTVGKDDTVAVRVTSSASFSTAVSATTTIGGIQDTFSVTTRAGVSTQVPQGTGTAQGTMTSGGGVAAAFNGNENEGYITSAYKESSTAWVGKYWGSGVTKIATQIVYISCTNYGIWSSANPATNIAFEGSNNGSSWTTLAISSFTDTNNKQTYTITTANRTPYNYHRARVYNNTGFTGYFCICSELKIYALA